MVNFFLSLHSSFPFLLYLYSFGDTHLQDQINIKSLQRLVQYYEKFCQRFGSVGLHMSQKTKTAGSLLQQLRTQVHARKTKNTDILTLSAEVRERDEGEKMKMN